jgi:hypothetical protein
MGELTPHRKDPKLFGLLLMVLFYEPFHLLEHIFQLINQIHIVEVQNYRDCEVVISGVY